MADAAERAGAVLTIDLDAIVANWRLLNRQLGPGARAAAGCARFCVATLDEGIALRHMLPEAEIHVFSGPFAGTEPDFVGARLTPVLNSPEQIAAWAAHCRRVGRRLAAAVHVDTGLSRLGLRATEARQFAADDAARDAIDLVLVMSHLVAGDEAGNPINRDQLDRFTAVRAEFPGVAVSLASSSGIFLGHEWHADWVRPGAALYGANPTPDRPNPMAQVVHLQGRIIQVRAIDAGETVGYGATWRAPASTRLAVVAAGYADGLLRSLSNRGSAMAGGSRVPLVGRVSMDLVVFDVGALPEGAVRPGGFVTLIGPGNTVDQVGAAAGTNGYEILTSLGRRYHRIWRGGQADHEPRV